MASTDLVFASREEHRTWLASQVSLPRGFRVGTTSLEFVPVEAPRPARMRLTVIALDRHTPSFGALFTRNAFAGSPVLIGRERLGAPKLGAVIVNNKVANVGAPDGRAAAEAVCAAVATGLGLAPTEVLPCSTGVIGWRLPVEAMTAAMPLALAALQDRSALPAAEAIMTTDLYPKVRRADVGVGGGSVVGVAKGAGMVEPHLGTMLAFLLTDLAVEREVLRGALARAAARSFDQISIDGDTSTSDTVVALSSGAVPTPNPTAFEEALTRVCSDLAEDLVRNGEGVHHVIRVRVRGAPDSDVGHRVGKAVINSLLVGCAVGGNDPNVGRIAAAVGKEIGLRGGLTDLRALRLSMAGRLILADGMLRLDPDAERELASHLRQAELYASVTPPDGRTFRPPVDFPPHERCVEIDVDLGAGGERCTVLGADRTHEYVTENSDYRS